MNEINKNTITQIQNLLKEIKTKLNSLEKRISILEREKSSDTRKDNLIFRD